MYCYRVDIYWAIKQHQRGLKKIVTFILGYTHFTTQACFKDSTPYGALEKMLSVILHRRFGALTTGN